ncbi:exodeoxyribonuclease I [Candidatus Pelagibacter sp.]|nr:exodeoxyribonuclease I [Candidatus Pelagibacter sp.]MDA9663402.1 exodeoxyribonuclease I [Candidatus Pelagibacter sp.]
MQGGAHAVDESVVKTEINAKGNAVMKLESLARMNGFESSGAHSALFDAELTVKVLGLIKKKQPQTWETFLRTANKNDTETILKTEKMFTLAEYHFGKNYKFVVAPLHPKHCIHPIYQWGQAFDLKVDPNPLFNMSISELKSAIKKLKFLRTIRSNKAPIILDASYGIQAEPYKNLDLGLIKERAKLVNSNEKFSKNVLTALRETAEEKAHFDSQVDLYAEETIYKKFTPQKDTALFPKWHSSSWKDKLILLDKFEDERMVSFGKKIIFQESPETLPPDMLKNIKAGIAERILSDDKEKWWTCKEFYFECDNLRDKFTNEKDHAKLKFLDEINEFVEGIQKKYENF